MLHIDYLRISYFKGLDGLRAFSILLVIYHHTEISKLFHLNGFLGVDFFFVLSGFLITTLILRERKRTGRFSLKNFYIRRILRLFPLYYIILISLLGYYYFIKYSPEYLELFPYYFLYLSNYLKDGVDVPNLGITWSLAVEEQFYLTWPFLERIIPKQKLIVWIILFLIFLNQLINFKIFNFQFDLFGPLAFRVTGATYTPILIGILIAHLLHVKRSYLFIKDKLVSKFFLIPVLLLATYILTISSDISGIYRLAFHVCSTYIMIYVLLNPNVLLTRFLSFPLFKRIGVVSYGIYLFHMTVNHFIPPTIFGPISEFTLVSIVSYIAAEVSYHCYEKRFLALKKKYKET